MQSQSAYTNEETCDIAMAYGRVLDAASVFCGDKSPQNGDCLRAALRNYSKDVPLSVSRTLDKNLLEMECLDDETKVIIRQHLRI
jgi:hypothetical protein